MEELRLSRSRASRLPVDRCSGELPFNMWDGMADGLELGGDPEPMIDMKDGLTPLFLVGDITENK
jgi:hypothetical protein